MGSDVTDRVAARSPAKIYNQLSKLGLICSSFYRVLSWRYTELGHKPKFPLRVSYGSGVSYVLYDLQLQGIDWSAQRK